MDVDLNRYTRMACLVLSNAIRLFFFNKLCSCVVQDVKLNDDILESAL